MKSEIREKYLNWLLTPPAERQPQTKTDFADEHNVARSTLYEWENSDDFQEELRALIGKWGVRQYSEIMNKLMEILMTAPPTPAVAAARELLRHIDTTGGKQSEDEVTETKLKDIREALKKGGFAIVDGDQD